MPLDCPHCQKSIKDAMPKSRFDEVYADRKRFKDESTQLKSELETAQTAADKAEGHTTRITELEGQLASSQDQFTTYQALTAGGFTDSSVIAGVEAAYRGLPEQGRPELAAWVDSMKADPTKAPTLLRPHFERVAAGSPPAAPPAPGAPPKAPAPGAPPANRGTRPAPAAPSQFTPQQIAAMSPQEYRANRHLIMPGAPKLAPQPGGAQSI